MGRQADGSRSGYRPSWWLLYLLAAIVVGVVGLAELLVAGEILRTILEFLTVALGFGLIGVWLRCNRIALELQRERHRP